MAKYLNSDGLKRALGSVKTYVDNGKTALETEIAKKQDILGFEGTYNKSTNKVVTKNAMDGVTGALTDLNTTAKGTLVAAINEANTAAGAASTAAANAATAAANAKSQSVVTVEKLATAESGFAASYHVKQNGVKVGATINIPKDYLVQSAEIKTATGTEEEIKQGIPTGKKYIDFVINAMTAPGNNIHLMLNVTDLVEDFTVEKNASSVQLAVSANRELSANIVDGSINGSKLSTDVVSSLEKADGSMQAKDYDTTALKKISTDNNKKCTVLNDALLINKDLTVEGSIAGMDAEFGGEVAVASVQVGSLENYKIGATSNMSLELDKKVDKVAGKGLSTNDLTSVLKSGYDTAAAQTHTHSNKALLDTYDQTNTNISDAIDKKHAHSNKGELDKIVAGDKAKWDTAATLASTSVQVEAGKSLIDDTEITRLAGMETGAQVNVIETVKVNGTALSVTSKAVNIDISGKVDKVTGKGLSTNDYTDAAVAEVAKVANKVDKVSGKSLILDTEITRLAGMATGATADSALSNDEVDAALVAAGIIAAS